MRAVTGGRGCRGWAIVTVAAGLVLVAACAGLVAGPKRLAGARAHRFAHDNHQMECAACHEAVFEAHGLGTALLPREATCLECHRERKDRGECGFCHVDAKRPMTWPAREASIAIDHARHLALPAIKDRCEACHRMTPARPGEAGVRPTMATCLGCHEHRRAYDDGRCAPCHLDLGRYPLRPISSFSHQGNFVREHARSARAREATCATCHDATFCADCHARTASPKVEIRLPEAVERDFIHRNDYLGRHAVEAAADPALCRRCHGQGYCQACHTLNNLTSAGTAPRSLHARGWASARGGGGHGEAARRDIASCAACHDQGRASVCVDCHKVGGIGGDPHPAGWRDRHGKDEIQRNTMCLYCHS